MAHREPIIITVMQYCSKVQTLPHLLLSRAAKICLLISSLFNFYHSSVFLQSASSSPFCCTEFHALFSYLFVFSIFLTLPLFFFLYNCREFLALFYCLHFYPSSDLFPKTSKEICYPQITLPLSLHVIT